mmetsp:Transcript_2299/g.6682  ORF Transcript_2299/g.6682 Transcript_2299/m.6682 type:complete len:298 (-) Transcript_2299:8-901(-)
MVARFKQKVKEAPAPPSGAGASPPPPPSPRAQPSTASKDAVGETSSEEFKEQGNKLLLAKDYAGAVSCYTKAIQQDPNGAKSHIYFTNRAAAKTYLKQYVSAVDDCTAAIERDSTYIKAYLRLAAAQEKQSQWGKAVETYEKALSVDPGADKVPKLLEAARAKAGRGGAAPGAPPTGGMPPFMPPGGMNAFQEAMGGGGGLAGLMQNPAMMQMAQQMMSNPAMMQQAQQMMSNPAMMQQAQQMMGDPAMMQQAMGALGLDGEGDGSGGDGGGSGGDLADLQRAFAAGLGGEEGGASD